MSRKHNSSLVCDRVLGVRSFARLGFVQSGIEIEALALGLAEVRHTGDPALAKAGAAVLGKVAATLPSTSQQHILHPVSQAHRFDDEQRYPPLPDMRAI